MLYLPYHNKRLRLILHKKHLHKSVLKYFLWLRSLRWPWPCISCLWAGNQYNQKWTHSYLQQAQPDLPMAILQFHDWIRINIIYDIPNSNTWLIFKVWKQNQVTPPLYHLPLNGSEQVTYKSPALLHEHHSVFASSYPVIHAVTMSP